MTRAPMLGHELQGQRRALIGWSIALASIVALMLAVWPSVRDMGDIQQFLSNYPEAFQKMFNMQDYASGAGYLNAELFSSTLPVLLIVYAIGRGAKTLAGEEESGWLELELVTPVHRTRLLAEKAAALVVALGALGAVVFVTTAVGGRILSMEVPVSSIAIGVLATTLLAIEHGLIALAVGAATGSRALAIAVAAGVAVAGYLLHVLGQLLTSFEPWSVLSPFRQALEGGPIGTTTSAGLLAVALVGVAVVLAVAPRWRLRDVGV